MKKKEGDKLKDSEKCAKRYFEDIKKEFEEAKINGNVERQHALLDALFSYSLWIPFELSSTDILKEISVFIKENDYI